MTTVTLSWEDPEDAATFLRLREEYLRQSWLPDPSMAELLELVRAGEVVNDDDQGELRHPLISAEFITPDRPGQFRVLLTCGCGEVTDLTFEDFHVVAGEAAWACPQCGTPHWFPVREDGGEEGSGDG